MFFQSCESISTNDGYSLPVESIMKCDDFKSNFARKLSNRYTSRSPVASPKKLHPENVEEERPQIVPERIETRSQLSHNTSEQIGPKKFTRAGRSSNSMAVHRTEVNHLNMEVKALKWQLAQTEANRQMHIALIKQILSFLNRVKEHIETRIDEPGSLLLIDEKRLKRETLVSKSSKSFVSNNLPRSRSIFHINKNPDFTSSLRKKINSRKIHKSISNVSEIKDYSDVWSPSKLHLVTKPESSMKISEEISRLVTLTNNVLSTKLPNLSCNLNELNDFDISREREPPRNSTSTVNLNSIDEDCQVDINVKETPNVSTANKNAEIKEESLDSRLVTLPVTSVVENKMSDMKLEDLNEQKKPEENRNENRKMDNVSSFIDDESGFSSMSSFQDVGIPIISDTPSPANKEMSFIEEISDFLEESLKWRCETSELEQTVKVFWV